MMNPEEITQARVACALVHLAEFVSGSQHAFDVIAARTILESPDVVAYLEGLDKLALLPRRRDGAKPWEV